MKTFVTVLSLMLCQPFGICVGQNAIVQPDWNWNYNINLAPPIGQTFIAVDPDIATIGLLLQNLAAAPATITYDLFAGDGTSGSLLRATSFVLPPNTGGYSDVDFSSVTLTVGNPYTVIVSTPANDCVIALEQFATGAGQPIPGMADYPEGNAIISGQPSSLFDLAFRVEPVPEPESARLVIVGSILFVIHCKHVQRRRRPMAPPKRSPEPIPAGVPR